MLGAPLNAGFLAGRDRYDYGPEIPEGFKEKRRKMSELAEKHGTDLRTAALQFCAAPKVVSMVIPGARTAEQVRENVASLTEKIPGAFWDDMKGEGLISPEAPVPT